MLHYADIHLVCTVRYSLRMQPLRRYILHYDMIVINLSKIQNFKKQLLEFLLSTTITGFHPVNENCDEFMSRDFGTRLTSGIMIGSYN